ncbi:hypothetical protein CL659_00585 [bacterium]|nr:hypothetical protein [bacterium]|tara:strand:- start:20388 stop:21749 length:1362 start_codon:yes stop_codon:yes gene_type:complete
MKKIIKLLPILIIAISACGGNNNSNATHPIAYNGQDLSVAPTSQTPAVYSETHYIYDFQGNNYLLACNSSGLSVGQLEIYKDISGSFSTTEKMTIGGGIGCSGVTAIIDNNNSVYNSVNSGVLHIFATEDIPTADTYVTYWCWDGTWSTGGSLQGCGSSLSNTVGGGAPTAAIDTTNNTLLLAWQESFDDLGNPINMGLNFMDYPLANLQANPYDFTDWNAPVSIDGGGTLQSYVGSSPILKTNGAKIYITARYLDLASGKKKIKLYHCVSACGQISQWSGADAIYSPIAEDVTESFGFEINPFTSKLTLVYQNDSTEQIVYKEWSPANPWTAGPEREGIGMAYAPINLRSAQISLAIETSGRKHIFWWEHGEHNATNTFKLHHRFSINSLWSGDMLISFTGSGMDDMPINMQPSFDGNLSQHGDYGFRIGYSRLVTTTTQEFVVSIREPEYN